jgi:predicted ArsR family transcriptional regulator
MTVKETAKALGVSERTIQRHLKDLRKDGLSDNVVVLDNDSLH